MKLYLTAALLALPVGVSAQVQCAPHEVITGVLAEAFGETRQGLGVMQDGPVMELFANDETGTWTVTVTEPGNLTCIVAGGEAWTETNEHLPPAGEDM
ncbi:hypothetical protein [Sulfitobacter sp.]|uniref:hypothetical protein n=1 Tax=Sulfitobacter sp. TaxID=1903071 RepID=UPI003F6BAB34